MKKDMTYMDSVHRDGRIWNLSVMVILIAFPIAVAAIFSAAPDWKGFLMGLVSTAPMYWAVAVSKRSPSCRCSARAVRTSRL